jgi:hypothetical protein
LGTRTALAVLAAVSILWTATSSFAADPSNLTWRKPTSGAAKRASAPRTTKTPAVRQASGTDQDAARSPVLNAANVETPKLRAARTDEGSVVRRSQADRYAAQADPKPAKQPAENGIKDILEGIEKPSPKDEKLPEMKDNLPPIDDLPPPPAEKRAPGRLEDLDLPKEKPAEPAQPKTDDVRPKIDEDIIPTPRPKEEPPTQRDESKPTEEQCREEEILRNEYLMGKDLPGGERREGDLEYCSKAIEELKALRVADPKFTIDISPPQPTGVEEPQCDRDWHDGAGRVLFRGRPHDFDAQGNKLTFRLLNGELKTIRAADLSVEDIGHFAMMYHLPVECVLEQVEYRPRAWAASTFVWKASALCHKPTYFEDEHLERYGHSHGPLLQPFISAGHFFGTFPVLPYKMGLTPPHECLYTLGYYRPGNCAPYMHDPIPLSLRAAAIQAGAITAGVAIFP